MRRSGVRLFSPAPMSRSTKPSPQGWALLFSGLMSLPPRQRYARTVPSRNDRILVVKATAKPRPTRPSKTSATMADGAAKAARSEPLFLQHLFATNVRLVRLARGISQEELAHLASLDRTYISSIERRLRNLS